MEKKLFFCSECDRGFSAETSRIRHYDAQHRGRRFLCPYCTSTYCRIVDIKKHVARAHSSRTIPSHFNTEYSEDRERSPQRRDENTEHPRYIDRPTGGTIVSRRVAHATRSPPRARVRSRIETVSRPPADLPSSFHPPTGESRIPRPLRDTSSSSSSSTVENRVQPHTKSSTISSSKRALQLQNSPSPPPRNDENVSTSTKHKKKKKHKQKRSRHDSPRKPLQAMASNSPEQLENCLENMPNSLVALFGNDEDIQPPTPRETISLKQDLELSEDDDVMFENISPSEGGIVSIQPLNPPAQPAVTRTDFATISSSLQSPPASCSTGTVVRPVPPVQPVATGTEVSSSLVSLHPITSSPPPVAENTSATTLADENTNESSPPVKTKPSSLSTQPVAAEPVHDPERGPEGSEHTAASSPSSSSQTPKGYDSMITKTTTSNNTPVEVEIAPSDENKKTCTCSCTCGNRTKSRTIATNTVNLVSDNCTNTIRRFYEDNGVQVEPITIDEQTMTPEIERRTIITQTISYQTTTGTQTLHEINNTESQSQMVWVDDLHFTANDDAPGYSPTAALPCEPGSDRATSSFFVPVQPVQPAQPGQETSSSPPLDTPPGVSAPDGHRTPDGPDPPGDDLHSASSTVRRRYPILDGIIPSRAAITTFALNFTNALIPINFPFPAPNSVVQNAIDVLVAAIAQNVDGYGQAELLELLRSRGFLLRGRAREGNTPEPPQNYDVNFDCNQQ